MEQGCKPFSVITYPQLDTTKQDWVAEEVPVALIYNGISHTVMMATPDQLEAFAIGFSLAEGIIASAKEIYGIDIIHHDNGIEIHIELASRCFSQLKENRRSMAGRTGCGICGSEQLAQVRRPLSPLPFTQQYHLYLLPHALHQLRQQQKIKHLTGCTHAVGWLNTEGELLAVCEDIGRHVALDKLLGLRHKQQWQNGAVIISSRASYEMVQKAAMCGVELLFACSAPTSLAIETAQTSRLTLVGFCRGEHANIYTHPERLQN